MPTPNGLGTVSNTPRQTVPAMPATRSMAPRENVVTVTRGQPAIRPMTTVPKMKPNIAPKAMTMSSDGSFGQPRTAKALADVAARYQYR